MSEQMTIGDVRSGLVKDHKELIEKAMNKNNPKHDKNYFILVCADNVDGNIKTWAFVMPVRPPIDLLGTMLYEVNPKTGEYTVPYCLPRDIPNFHVITDKKRTSVQDVIAQNCVDNRAPIIH